MKKIIIVGDNLALKLSKKLNTEVILTEERIFPDGEIKPRLKKETSAQTAVLIIQKKQKENINDYLLRFYLLSCKLKENYQKVIGILPYLPYARQDTYFLEGDPFSLKYIAEMIESKLDVFITVNMHEHRKKINEVFNIENHNLSVFKFYAEKYFSKINKTKNLILVGPDDEAKHFVNDFRKGVDLPYYIFEKERDFKTGKVNFKKPNFDFANKDVLILDDIISSGGTIIKVVKILKEVKAKSLSLGICHGLFSPEFVKNIAPYNISQIIVSNSVENTSSNYDITEMIASFLEQKLLIK